LLHLLHLCGAQAFLKVPASNTFAAIGSPLSTPCVNHQLFEFVDAASPNWHLGDNLEQSQVWADRSPNTFKN
jgi:hypothetical protein